MTVLHDSNDTSMTMAVTMLGQQWQQQCYNCMVAVAQDCPALV